MQILSAIRNNDTVLHKVSVNDYFLFLWLIISLLYMLAEQYLNNSHSLVVDYFFTIHVASAGH